MITRASQSLLATLKEAPGDAEALSHKLLIRGGFIRQLAAGLYTFLPSGVRVQQRIMTIIREEMNAIGGQEVLMPLINPRELWETTGRVGIDVQYAFRDRSEREMVLALTHEEAMTYHAARELQSYRDLPQIWWQLQLKGRDEARARGGLLRTREFIMKDAYSFDRDDAGLDESYAKHESAYRRIFDRCELEYHVVESDTGDMGGSTAHEYMAPCDAGENVVALCAACGYKANTEVAVSTAAPRTDGAPPIGGMREVATPTQRTITEVAGLLGVPHAAIAKSMPVVTDSGQLVLALVRGDHALNLIKLRAVVGGAVRQATVEEIVEHLGAPPGFLGPVGVDVPIVYDQSLDGTELVVGANRDGVHLEGVQAGREFAGTAADIRDVAPGDTCARCDGSLRLEQVIEIGNIFKLGTRYSEPLGATYLDQNGSEQLIVMGSYGIGPARIMAATAEQRGDARGIAWPPAIAPHDVHVVAIGDVAGIAETVAAQVAAGGCNVFLDDRGRWASPGAKFADADLIGAPLRITVGKRARSDGLIDVQARAGEARSVPIDEAAHTVATWPGDVGR